MFGFIGKIKERIKNTWTIISSKRKLIGIIIVAIIIVAAVPLTVIVSQQQQTIKQRASELAFYNTNICDGYGDINDDGMATIKDSMFISQYLATPSALIDFSEEQKLRADVNNDGKIDEKDISLISLVYNPPFPAVKDTFLSCSKVKPLMCDSYGDVNGKGYISPIDSVLIAKSLGGLVSLDAEQKLRADVDGANDMTITDAIFIGRYLAGNLPSFPRCAPSAPTSMPTLTLSPSIAPTSTLLPTSASSPTPSVLSPLSPAPTSSMPGNEIILKSIKLTGISTGAVLTFKSASGATPQTVSKVEVEAEVRNTANSLLGIAYGDLVYDSYSGLFNGGIKDWKKFLPADGGYTIKLKVARGYLAKVITPSVILGQSSVLTGLTFYAGDLNGDGIIDGLDYNLLLTCVDSSFSTGNCRMGNSFYADFNFDGAVNGKDIDLILNYLKTISSP